MNYSNLVLSFSYIKSLIVKHAISILPSESAEIIRLKFDQQKSYAEISEATGLSQSNVGYKLHHIIKDIAQELESEGFFK